MREVRGNLWTYPADYRIITTNGSIRADGCAVMGRGCAVEAADRFPFLPRELAGKLTLHGNHVFLFEPYRLLTFPVKDVWHEMASLDLVQQSIKELQTFLHPTKRYVMPRAGTGYGRLDWVQVKPLLDKLPHNVRVITYTGEDE